MASKKVIAVTGATGMQGGSVARFLAEDGTFAVRAITRDPKSAKAEQLKSQYPSIELVQASLDDPSSLEKALEGAYGVFGLTNFWEHGQEGEIRQGKNLVDAAKAVGIKHFVYSTLDNGDPAVPHWISKWEVDEHLKKSGVPRTSLYTGFYIENLLNPMMAPKPVGENAYLLPLPILPDAPIFCFPANDTGAWVLAALKDPETWIGKDMRVVSEWLSTREMAAIASKVSGKKISPLELDQAGFEATRNAPWQGAEEIYLNMVFFVKHGPDSGVRDQEMSLKVHPKPTTFEQHIKEHQNVLFK